MDVAILAYGRGCTKNQTTDNTKREFEQAGYKFWCADEGVSKRMRRPDIARAIEPCLNRNLLTQSKAPAKICVLQYNYFVSSNLPRFGFSPPPQGAAGFFSLKQQIVRRTMTFGRIYRTISHRIIHCLKVRRQRSPRRDRQRAFYFARRNLRTTDETLLFLWFYSSLEQGYCPTLVFTEPHPIPCEFQLSGKHGLSSRSPSAEVTCHCAQRPT